MRQGEDFAYQDFGLFNRAWRERDWMTLASLVKQMHKQLEEAHTKLRVAGLGVDPLIRALDELSKEGTFARARHTVLNFLANAVSGHRENLVYYRIDSSIEWMELRFNSTQSGIHRNMPDAWKHLINGRAALQRLGPVLGDGFRIIRDETSEKYHDYEKVRAVCLRMIDSLEMNAKYLMQEVSAAMQSIEAVMTAWEGLNQDPSRKSSQGRGLFPSPGSSS